MRLLRIMVLAALIGALSIPASGTQAQGINPPRGTVVLKLHRISVEITDQVAVTTVEQVFVNEGNDLAEGQYLFPLPDEAAVSDLTLTIDGQVFKPQILSAEQARQIYDSIVRQRRDPALLQYVGRRAIEAKVFPIPPRAERTLTITYSHILKAENGLLEYSYPLKTDYVSSLPVRQIALSVSVESTVPLGSTYSPNPFVLVSRESDFRIRAGFEASGFRADEEFQLYYGLKGQDIDATLITYRESADQDGFFMLIVTPPLKVEANRAIAKDVIFVLDQSGSMAGDKWTQAQAAARYVLRNLNPQDRFNVVAFSTGYRIYANAMQPVAEAEAAVRWIDSLEAVGGTNIDLALATALKSADPSRKTVVLFLTDGLPTEGVITPSNILENVAALATKNTRIFSFGVGNDVDTNLLDTLSSTYGGVSVYVRPNENIEQDVSTLYSKITAPVLSAPTLTTANIILEDTYPTLPLPDLFAGSQMILTGRYRGTGTTNITLSGEVGGLKQEFTYNDLLFPANAGGQPFIARLWATRKIGYLLNQIRLRGENPELVQSVVTLSRRYGIITPYTSFLVQENPGLVTEPIIIGTPGVIEPPSPGLPGQGGRDDQQGQSGFGLQGGAGSSESSGSDAVERAEAFNELQGADKGAPPPPAATQTSSDRERGGGEMPEPRVRIVRDRTFVWQNGVWTDTLFTADMARQQVKFMSDEYFNLLAKYPTAKDFFALGMKVLVVFDGIAYEVIE